MKLVPLFAASLLLSLLSCTTSTTTSTGGYDGEVTPSDNTGAFGPFRRANTWDYQQLYCDSTDTPRCDTLAARFDVGSTLTIYKWQVFKLYDRLMHLNEGNYYEYQNDELIKVLVENPTAGMTWTSGERRVHDFTVIGVGQTLTVPAGTFTDVVHLEVVITGDQPRTETLYYQKGVGLLQREEYPATGIANIHQLKHYYIL